MITVHYDDGGVQRELHLQLERLSDLNPVLRRFGRHLRAKARDRFAAQGPGWEPLAVSTIERLQETRTDAVTAHGKVRASYAKNLGAYLWGQIKRGKVSRSARGQLDYLVGGGEASVDLQSQVEEKLRSRAVERLRKKVLAAQDKGVEEIAQTGKRQIERHKLLGKLSSSLAAEVAQAQLVVRSKVPWAGVHNDGGSAGRGTKVPARPFLFLEPEDMQVLEDMAIEYVTEPDEAE